MKYDRPFAHQANIAEYLPWLAKGYVPLVKRLPSKQKNDAGKDD